MPDEFVPQPAPAPGSPNRRSCSWRLIVALDHLPELACQPCARRRRRRRLCSSCRRTRRRRAEVITPREPSQRGGQLSLRFGAEAKAFHEALTEAGVVCDFREPDCVRLAVAPLYTRFEDLVRFVEILEETRHG